MQLDESFFQKVISKDLMEFTIRIALIAFLVIASLRIFSPFMPLVLWALVLAVTLYPLNKKLAKRLGDKPGRASTLLVLAGVLLIGVPTIMLGSSFADEVHDLHTAFENNTVTINPPKPSVAEWPLVGKKLYAGWSLAASNLPAFMEKLQPQLGSVSKAVLGMVASSAGALLSFIGSLIIAGIMMAYGESGAKAMRQIMIRLAGQGNGPHLHSLSVATIRSVALGVIGVAFIQALLLGIGFLVAGIPAAGLLALIALLLGIAQIPALLVSAPAIAYLWWSGDSTVMNIVFTVYLAVAGMADNVLKPLMLGRGVDAPMPIILIGALGGMVAGGMIGLFLGAVFLALAYNIFMEWVAEADTGENEPEEPGSEAAPEPTQ